MNNHIDIPNECSIVCWLSNDINIMHIRTPKVAHSQMQIDAIFTFAK
jgi:hypothetical protein